MKNSKGINNWFALVALLFFAASCHSSKSEQSEATTAFDPVGDWEYMVTTDVSRGVITITEEAGTYAAIMTTEVFGTLEVMALKIEGTTLSGDLDVGGTAAKIKCEFDGNEIKGAVTAGDDRFPFEGNRAGK